MELNWEEFQQYLKIFTGLMFRQGFRVYAGNKFYTANNEQHAIEILAKCTGCI
jgi:hypothetical protein